MKKDTTSIRRLKIILNKIFHFGGPKSSHPHRKR